MRITPISLLCLVGASDGFLQPASRARIAPGWKSSENAEGPLFYSKSSQGLVSEVNNAGGGDNDDANFQRAIGPSLERAQQELDNINIDDFMSTISSEIVPHLRSVENMVRSINSLKSAGGTLRSAVRVLDSIDLEPLHRSLVITIQSSIKSASKKVKMIDIDSTSRIFKEARPKNSTDTSKTSDSKLSPVEILIDEGDYDQALRRTVEDSKNAIDDIDAVAMVDEIVGILETYIAEYYKHVNGLMALSMSITSSLPESGKKDEKRMPSATAMGTGSQRKSDSFVPALSHARQQLALLNFDAVSANIADILERPVSKAWEQLQKSNEDTTRILLSKVKTASDGLVSKMLDVVENLTTSPGLSTILDPKNDGLIAEVDPDNLDAIFEEAELDDEVTAKMGSTPNSNRRGQTQRPQARTDYGTSPRNGASRSTNYGTGNSRGSGGGRGGFATNNQYSEPRGGAPKYGASPGYNVRDDFNRGNGPTQTSAGLVRDSTDLVGDTTTGSKPRERGWDSSGQGSGRFSRPPQYPTPRDDFTRSGGPMYGGGSMGPKPQPGYNGRDDFNRGERPPMQGGGGMGPGYNARENFNRGGRPPMQGGGGMGPGQQPFPGSYGMPPQGSQFAGLRKDVTDLIGDTSSRTGRMDSGWDSSGMSTGRSARAPSIYDGPQYGGPPYFPDLNQGGRPGGGPMYGEGRMGPRQQPLRAPDYSRDSLMQAGSRPMYGGGGPMYGGGGGPMPGRGGGPMYGGGGGPMYGGGGGPMPGRGGGPIYGGGGPMQSANGMGPMQHFQNPNGMTQFGAPFAQPKDFKDLMSDGAVYNSKSKKQSQSSQSGNDYGVGQYPAVEFAPRDYAHLMNDGSVFSSGGGGKNPQSQTFGFGSPLPGTGQDVNNEDSWIKDSQYSNLNPTIEQVCNLIETSNSYLAKAQAKIDVASETPPDSALLSQVDSSNTAAAALMVKASRTLTELCGIMEDYVSSAVYRLEGITSPVQRDQKERVPVQFQAMLDVILSTQTIMDTTVTEYHQMAKENRDLRGNLLQSQTELIKANEEIVTYEKQAQEYDQFRLAVEQNKFNLKDAIQLVSSSQGKHRSLYEANMCLMNAINVSRRALDDYESFKRRTPRNQPSSSFYSPPSSNNKGYGDNRQTGGYGRW